MQPLLLLKQTLEAAYDPGPLLLDGANVRFTRARQLFYRDGEAFELGIDTTNNLGLRLRFTRQKKQSGLQLAQTDYRRQRQIYSLTPNMKSEEVEELIKSLERPEMRQPSLPGFEAESFRIVRNRCFLETFPTIAMSGIRYTFAEIVQSMIHLPGLRGNPERTYPVSAVGITFPGTFEKYTASIIAKWQEEKSSKVAELGKYLLHLGLTWKVEAKRVDDTRVELRVGRTRSPQQGGAKDMVSVADVGFGVSQTLPVLVALLAARPGQLVYLEQPEIHLHPRAQVAMASILADATRRKVRVVVETHSSLLLLATQTLIAEESLSTGDVKLHWFGRDEKGETTITSGELDEAGAFGNWPEDFGNVELEAQQRYLDAAERKLAQMPEGDE